MICIVPLFSTNYFTFSSMLMSLHFLRSFFFFFNDTATTEIYTLSLHDALPICRRRAATGLGAGNGRRRRQSRLPGARRKECRRSEEHTSELQSRLHLVCRLLLEKKKKSDHQNTQY